MGEFIGRWVLLGGVSVGALAAAGARTGGGWGWVLVWLWFGFCNAALRPLVLRLPVTGWQLLLWLFVVMALLNGVLFFSASAWLPFVGLTDWRNILFGVGLATLCSWAASSRFRAHDGRWHWITHHGSVMRP